ncbi:helix-turn-helix domain-containing protein [Saccharopolyspora halophila]|uniref:Helix-turn-helix domain-containing protein n=1 Tax=Saccharopolyspora halophila TaxID=405551 RepID=A0ABP5SZY7_9PSEU
MELVKVVGDNLKAARLQHGLSLSEVARRAGIGKGTLSELESGRRNPTLETLYALATVLDVPLGWLLIAESADSDDSVVVSRAGAADLSGQAVDVELMDRIEEGGQRLEIFRLQVRQGGRYVSGAHRPRVIEQILVHSGTLVVGPKSAPESLGSGDYIRFEGTSDHIYEAPHGDVLATLIMRYP